MTTKDHVIDLLKDFKIVSVGQLAGYTYKSPAYIRRILSEGVKSGIFINVAGETYKLSNV